MTVQPDPPRYVYYGVNPKRLQAKSLRKLEAARKKIREISVLWPEVSGTVEYAADRDALDAMHELEVAIRDGFDYLNEPIPD